MLAGFRTLIHTGHGPRSIGAVDPLGDEAFGAKPAGVLEHNRAVLSNVFVEQDASLSIAQEPRQLGLAVKEREIAQILAIVEAPITIVSWR